MQAADNDGFKKGQSPSRLPVIKAWFGHYYFLVVSFLVVSIPAF